MGEIHADVTLENPGDRAVVERGHGQESDIRRSTIDAIVDTGAVTLVLPQNVVERLGLGQRGYRVRHVRRRAPGGTAAGRAGDSSDRQPFHEHGLCRRPAPERTLDRPGRPRNPRSDRRLHESDARSAIPRLSAAQAEVGGRMARQDRNPYDVLGLEPSSPHVSCSASIGKSNRSAPIADRPKSKPTTATLQPHHRLNVSAQIGATRSPASRPFVTRCRSGPNRRQQEARGSAALYSLSDVHSI